MTDSETNRDKEQRNEREAANILSRAYGTWGVDKVHTHARNDPWNLADVIGIRSGWPIRVVQVKTNRFTAAARRKYLSRMRRFPHEHAVFEVWVRVDREGWRIHRYDPDTEEFETVIEMDTCDTEATVEAYREDVGYYDHIEDQQ